MAESPAIRTEGLTERFGSVPAVEDLNLEGRTGEGLGDLGPDGAGKTTTIRLLLGLIHPSAGRAEIFGLDCPRATVAATFDGAAPDVSAVPGVSDLPVADRRLRCQVRGPIEPLLAADTNAGVRELTSREPTLEELFLAYYGHNSPAATHA